MNRKDFVKEVSTSSGLTQSEVRKVFAAVHTITMAALRNGKSINLMGLGQLKLRPRGERVARDIRRNTTVTVPAGAVMRFVPTVSVAKDLRNTPVDVLRKGGQ